LEEFIPKGLWLFLIIHKGGEAMEASNQPDNIKIVQVDINELNPAPYNPRKWSDEATAQLKESISRFGMVDAIVVNGVIERRNVVIGGHFRLHVAKDLGLKEVPVVYVDIPDIDREKELN
jgi:ParB-like chromosome segregation protein Spo0J